MCIQYLPILHEINMRCDAPVEGIFFRHDAWPVVDTGGAIYHDLQRVVELVGKFIQVLWVGAVAGWVYAVFMPLCSELVDVCVLQL